MSEKQDRRKTRTKQLLRQALLELIEEKGMDRVTVSDLTERAGVNRGTFYLHYRDTADMIDRLKQEVYAGITALLLELNPLEVGQYARRGEAYPVGVKLLEYIRQQGDFFKVIIGPKGDPSFLPHIKSFIQDRLLHHILPQYAPSGQESLPNDYLIAFMASANLGIIAHWVETGMKLEPAELAKIITRFVSEGPLVTSGFVRRH